ncbi:hypothetical protein HYU13_06235 [Candidatus Woesearchaeota archaeon]|nr:hypothetical protein [Candidatus Woesearchaeota archaeon]
MYRLTTLSRKAEKQFYAVVSSREGAKEKIEKLKLNPRAELDAPRLRGRLEGKWSCSLDLTFAWFMRSMMRKKKLW